MSLSLCMCICRLHAVTANPVRPRTGRDRSNQNRDNKYDKDRPGLGGGHLVCCVLHVFPNGRMHFRAICGHRNPHTELRVYRASSLLSFLFFSSFFPASSFFALSHSPSVPFFLRCSPLATFRSGPRAWLRGLFLVVRRWTLAPWLPLFQPLPFSLRFSPSQGESLIASLISESVR